MTSTSIQQPPPKLLELAQTVETELDICLGNLSLPKHLGEAARYAVVNGGKRVRPALALLCCEAAGGSISQAMPASLAVELIHCFSLVHDDLPAIDNDDLRRGKPTLHVKSGEAMALLAGDLLLPIAFTQLISEAYTCKQQAKLTKLLAQATSDMVIGQVYDTLGGLPEHLAPQQQLEEIHRNKTGALIQCACAMGAICGNASEQEYEAIRTFGSAIGLMFQIVDDLIDLHGTAEQVGKATGKDEGAGKITYPGTIGVEASKIAVQELQKQAENALNLLNSNTETLSSFNLWMAHRTR